ncbi:TasA family protein, partial [Anaeromassilibacillus sp. 1001302B_160321_C8]|uniref:TasA family protein n=1 Tax=Anaeromassilibacillus sp. 1001302B_160321_C8 TaxID=2787132 RepID=UPI001FAD522D
MQKTKKSRAILSGISVLLVLCLLAGGTMAWFTDTEKVNTNFAAGILDVSVKPGEAASTDLTFDNLRPMLLDNFEAELAGNGSDKWTNDVTQDNTTGVYPGDYKEPVPAYFKPVVITNDGTLPTKVQISLELGEGCADGEPILTKDNITITQDGRKQDCANRLAPVLKVFVYKLVGEDWTLVE